VHVRLTLAPVLREASLGIVRNVRKR
jgi:hypothetical protein